MFFFQKHYSGIPGLSGPSFELERLSGCSTWFRCSPTCSATIEHHILIQLRPSRSVWHYVSSNGQSNNRIFISINSAWYHQAMASMPLKWTSPIGWSVDFPSSKARVRSNHCVGYGNNQGLSSLCSNSWSSGHEKTGIAKQLISKFVKLPARFMRQAKQSSESFKTDYLRFICS